MLPITSPSRRAAGFTLLEVLVVVAVLLIAATLLVPAIQRMLHRAKVEGFAREVAVFMQMGRAEAIKRNVDGVAQIDPATREVTIFVNVDGDEFRVFEPVPGAPAGTADILVWRQTLPAGVDFESPDGILVDGFTDELAVFLPDGSIEDVGAFRIGDGRGNFFEIRVAPQATARVQLRKWNEDVSRFIAADEDPGWRWY